MAYFYVLYSTFFFFYSLVHCFGKVLYNIKGIIY